MLQSKLLAKTKKKISKALKPKSYGFLIKGDFVEQLSAGIFSFLPLGFRVIKKIENIIREEMNSIGGQEVFLPSLQPKEIWQKTNRWNNMDPPLFKLQDRHKKEFALGSTHEEVITKIARDRIQSFRDLPLYAYQIQNKFRNEMRSTSGLLRNREFLMKDLYSFHADEKDLNKYFDKVAKSYEKIFKRCSLLAIKTQALGGTISDKGARTLEFQVKAEVGEDKIIVCKKCGFAENSETINTMEAVQHVCKECKAGKGKLQEVKAVELGHIFCLGDKYSKAFNFKYIDKKGKPNPVIMGCYGIGIGRLMGAAAEIHNDEKGLVWPDEIAPFRAHLIQIENNKKVKTAAQKIEQDLESSKIETLYDDRTEKSPGEKFADADLIGIPLRIVVSERTLEKGSVELKKRKEKNVRLVKLQRLSQFLNF